MRIETVIITGLLASGLAATAQITTQTISLQTGWNAIYLEVKPGDGNPATLLAGLPVASVWTRADRLSAVDFIQDPAELAFNQAEWLKWYPPPQPTFLSDLRELQAHRAYLVKLTNGPVTWQIVGSPVVRAIQWVTDAWNLRGFPVAATNPPTFRSYFQASANHYDTAQGRLRGVYRLGANGVWARANQDAPMRAGEACWVYCQGASSYGAPFEVKAGVEGGLDFGQDRERIDVEFNNLALGSRIITIRQSGDQVSGLLAYRRLNSTNGFEWVNLPNPFVISATNGTPTPITVAVRRSLMTEASWHTILEISDGQGIRYALPVRAERFGQRYAGLWAGNVTVTAVSEPHFCSLTTNLYALVDGQARPLSDPGLIVITNQVVYTNSSQEEVTTNLLVVQTTGGVQVPVYEKIERNPAVQNPTPTKSEFTMRVLLHVDGGGKARLLKEVVQMWRDGTYTNDNQGRQVADKPGTYVLVTEDKLLGQFKGSTIKDGVSVGRRLSAIGFDFDGKGTNHLGLAGTFAPGEALAGAISYGSDYPLNPFRHRYHPDHDNLDAHFAAISDPAQQEVYGVTRQVQFTFSDAASGSASSPDPAYSAMEGTYWETLTGLHKQAIQVQGTFRLSRASYISELNPSPKP
jgi:hypothetical protein